MERNVLFLIVGIITLLLVGGIVLLLQSDEGEETIPEEVSIQEPEADEAPAVTPEEESVEEIEREILEPEEYIPDQLAGMPASFREALGGYKGRVVEEGGIPVPNIDVEVLGAHFLELFHGIDEMMGEEIPEYDIKTARTTTEEDGTFFLPGVYPRKFYALTVDGQGSRPYLRILDRLPGPGEVVDLGDIVLPPFAVLLGVVEDDAGNPVAGARVRATELPAIVFMSGIQDYRRGCSFLIHERSMYTVIQPPPVFDRVFDRLPLPTVRTGPDGSFRLEGVPMGLVNVIVDRADFVTAKQGPVSTKKGGEKDLGTITLDRGNTVEGKVLDVNGKPVEGAEVRMGSIHGFKEFVVLRPPVFTDAEGRFIYMGFPSIPAVAAARRYPGDSWAYTAEPTNPAAESPVVTLPPGYDLRVEVVLEDGSPAKDARMKFRYKDMISQVSFLNPPSDLKARIERTGEGVFEIKTVPVGNYEVLVTAPDCAVIAQDVRIQESPVERRVVLKSAFAVRVRVLKEEDNTPVEWAEVYTSTDDDDWLEAPNKISRDRTDAEGLAILKKLSEDTYYVAVSHPKYAITWDELKVPSDDEEKVIYVKPGGTMEGVVFPGRTGNQPPFMVIMETRGNRDVPESQAPRVTVTDLEGKFRVTNLTPGEWRVMVTERIFHRDPSTMIDAIDMNMLTRTSANVESGQTTYVEIVLGQENLGPSGEVTGRVTVDGRPAEGATVRCWIKKNVQTKVDASGTYRMRIPAGNGTLSVYDFSGSSKGVSLSRNITVKENLTVYEDFDILTGAITGRLVDENGGMVTGGPYRITANLEGSDMPYRVWLRTETKEDGAFVFEKIPIGIYTVRSGDRNVVCNAAEGIKVRPGATAGPVVLTRFTPVLVKGKVLFPDDFSHYSFVALWCIPHGQEGGNGITVRVSTKTGEFETKQLPIGTYEAVLFGSRTKEYEPFVIDVPPGGVTNLVLTLVEKK